MDKSLYEELAARGLNVTRLPLNLAWTVPYLAQLDRTLGSEVITHKPIAANKN